MDDTPPPAEAQAKPKRIRGSVWLAVFLALAAVAWIASGNLDSPGLTEVAAEKTPVVEIRAVRVFESVARERQAMLIVSGRTEASRRVVVKAEISGTVRKTGAGDGDPVKQGDVLARLSIEDRQARYDEAKALVTQRQIEFEAANKLANKGFQSEIRRAEARAELDSAKAQLRQWRVELGRTVIRAPFNGIFHERVIELGDFVKPGDPIGTVTDLDPVLAVGDVSEREVGRLSLGDTASVRLVTGEEETGRITYIGAVANANTRTFRVEVEITETGNRIREGMTAELRLPTAQTRAHLISPGFLTLSDSGAIGLKSVDDDDTVRFHEIRILESSPQGMWVAGLPDRVRLITVGQEYVVEGEKVAPVPDTVLAPRLEAPGAGAENRT